MSGRRRCARCQRPVPQCFCARLTPVAHAWPVWIAQHPQEARHALGTARIAAVGLRTCHLALCAQEITPAAFPPHPHSPVLVYPREGAAPLETLPLDTPRPLLFLDGTWRKSTRMWHESPWLQSLPAYALHPMTPSRYRIRREPSANALSTLEAIVQALSTLEGEAHRFESMLAVMDQLIEEQIARMGPEVFARNYGESAG